MIRRERRRPVAAAFHATSDLLWKVMWSGVGVLALAVWIKAISRTVDLGTLFGLLALVGGAGVFYRQLRRCIWVYDDGRVGVRGFWYRAELSASDVTAVTHVPQAGRAAHRLYVSFTSPDREPLAVCIGAFVFGHDVQAVAEELVSALRNYRTEAPLLTTGPVPSTEVRNTWKLAASPALRRLGVLE